MTEQQRGEASVGETGEDPTRDTGGDATAEAEEQEHRLQRLSAQFVQQWAQARAQRRDPDPMPVAAGSSNLSRAQVPWGVDLAAAWSWRLLVISAAAYLLLWLMAYFAVITLPLVIALLLSALASPGVAALRRVRVPNGLAAGLVVIAGLGFVVLLLSLAGQQIATGAQDLADKVVQGLDEIRAWLKNGPLNASDSQINTYLTQAQDAITEGARRVEVGQVTQVGTAIGNVVAGFFIVLFASFFFLADGHRIWGWFVRLAPRDARGYVDGSGRAAWVSLTQFVRATVVIAAVDAIGVMVVAAVLGVPFVLAIGVLVFLGAFVPMIGATIAGGVAVLVALVDQGPFTALLMLLGVIAVQQLEGQVLQPILTGRFVSVHPLGVLVALGLGIVVAGVAGALVAVPLAAVVNSVVHYLARRDDGQASGEAAPDLPDDAGGVGSVPDAVPGDAGTGKALPEEAGPEQAGPEQAGPERAGDGDTGETRRDRR